MQFTTVKFLDFLFLSKFIKRENLFRTSTKLLLSMNSSNIDIKKLFAEVEDE